MTDQASTVGHSKKVRDLKGTPMQCILLMGAAVCFTKTSSPKGNDRSHESQQVKSSKYFNSSQVREQTRKITPFPHY